MKPCSVAFPLTLIALASLSCGSSPSEASETSGTTATTTMTTTSGTSMESSTGTAETSGETSTGEFECCGCLCRDPTWSCSQETCLLADGTVEKLGPEAGFLAIMSPAPAAQSRMWYAFRPADEQPEDKPLAVFFNGGPGSSSAILFGFNTNAVTLDPDIAGEAGIVDNPSSWTRFANVLYVDPREAGFSYDVPRDDGKATEIIPFVPEHDASYFVRLILRFLARHPQIQRNPVVLVGESYGGTRSALMLNQLLFHDDLETDNRFLEPDLHQEILDHYAVVFPDTPPEELTPELVAEQFGHQVLVQPAFTLISNHAGTTEKAEQKTQLGCVEDPDLRQCDEANDWPTPRVQAVVDSLLDPAKLSLALGVDATTIEWMYADARVNAYPRGKGSENTSEEAFAAVFGEISSLESYYYPSFARGLGSSSYFFTNEYYGRTYMRVIPFVDTFITNAGKDILIFAPDIPSCMATYADTVSAVVHDSEPFDEEPRPGRIFLTFTPEAVDGDGERIIRFPHYPDGGHMISHKSGAEFAEDIMRWLGAGS